jgi:type I restriction enzyme S subunit
MSVQSKPKRKNEAEAESPNDSIDLPIGWTTVKLQEIGSWRSGGTPSRAKPQYFGLGIPWVKSGDLPDGPIVITDEQITPLGLDNSAAKVMPIGTVCMALYGATIGKLGIMTFEAATNQATANLVPDHRLVDGLFVFYYLMSERQNFIDLGQGGAQPNISQEIVRNHPINIAPLAEQRRIVAKLETLLGKVSSNQKRLSRVPSLLKRFRQSVLAAACSGRLTADWREQNRSTEPSGVLLERIALQTRKSISNCDVGSLPFELPFNWTWVQAQDLCRPLTVITYGIIKPDWVDDGVPTVRVQDMQNGKLVVNAVGKCSRQRAEKFAKTTLETGDLLIAKDGATLGKTAIVPSSLAGGNITQHVLRFPINCHVDSVFIRLVIDSHHSQEWMRLETKGVALPGVNVGDFRRLLIPLPPLKEQYEIVSRVDKLFAFADQIEARLKQAKTHVDRLTQSLLRKAFRGELVPTEASLAAAEGRDYESASALLERIRTQPSDAPTKPKAKRS